MRRIIATFLLAAFALLTTTFAGLSVFGMGDHGGMDHHGAMGMDSCADTRCAPMTDTGTNDIGCINDCLSSATALTKAVLPMPLAFGFLAVLFIALVSEIAAIASSATNRTSRWREGIGKAFRRQSLATVILRN